MIRMLARWWARRKYVWNKEVEGAMHEWSAKVAERNAGMTRDVIAQLTKQVEDMDARIKEMVEMEAKGYWACEDGHEKADAFLPEDAIAAAPLP